MNISKSQKGFIAIAVLPLIILATLVIAVFAFHSMRPGQFLHTLKQATVEAELALAPGHEVKAKIRFKILEGHIKQIQITATKSDFDEAVDESQEFREEAAEVKHDIDEITEAGASADNITSRLQSLVDTELTTLKAAADRASGKDRDSINKEIQLTQALKVSRRANTDTKLSRD